MTDVRFAVLGRVAITVDGVDVTVGGRRERAVLAVLLAARGQVVSVDRLIEDIWGPAPGDTAQASLQVAVSRLRSLIEPGRAPRAPARVLVSAGAGYKLAVEPDWVDAERFSALVKDAQTLLDTGDAGEAAALCDRAGELWAGTPFAGVVDGELVRAEALRLEELRLHSLQLRAEALLALGRPSLVTGDLEALVAAYPFRERFWQLYALALYRCDRQADALAAVRRARAVLAEELGVDPSPGLRQLEADLLAQAPSLAGSVSPAAVPAVPAPPPTPRGPELVGRDGAVQTLRATLDEVLATRRGRTVVVTGEAGIGKSRLVSELASLVAERSATLTWGRCHDADASPPFWPWIPVVRTLAEQRAVGPGTAELLSPDATGGATTDADSTALRTYDAVSRLVATASADAPVVIVLEDVHWADTASLRLLAFAAEALAESPVLLVVTVRTVDAPSEALQTCLAALARLSAVRITLGGLASGDVRRLVSALTGSAAASELADVVVDRTDGNPFFVIELVRLLVAEQRLHPTGARQVDVPHGVQDVLRLRLARLPDDVRQLLGVAATVGRDFELHLVSAVAATDADTALDLLDVAVSAHAVEETERRGGYRFTHALVRETLYGSLTRARRGRLHAAIALALEPRLVDEPDLVAEVAHHFVIGAELRPELAESAVHHAISAASQAEGRGALDQALVHWEQALTADGLARGADLRRRGDVLVGLGRARYRRGDVAGTREALDAAVDAARCIGDVARMAEAATSFRGAGVWHWREFGTSDPGMVAVLQECLAALPPGPLHVRVLASLAMELTYEWRSEEADVVGRRAVEAARAVGDGVLFADVVSLRTLALWGRPGASAERLALADEVLALPLSHEQELYTRFGAAAAYLQAGETEAADLQMARCVELSRRLRHTGSDVPIAWWQFYRAVARGEEAAAKALGDEALDRHRRSSIVAIEDMLPMKALRLMRIGGDVPEAFVEVARRHANPGFRAFIAQALAEAGRVAEAVDLLGPPVPDGAWDYASVIGDCFRVDVLATAGRRDELPAALARIQPWGHEFAIFGSTDCAGSIDYFVGRGLEGLGDVEGARAAYSRAVERNRIAEIVPWRRRAEARLATLAASVRPSAPGLPAGR